MQTVISNIKHAIRNNETVSIGGGEFSPEELRDSLASIETMRAALQHYAYGGSEFKSQAQKGLEAYERG